MSQDVLLTMMNSMSLNNESANMGMQRCASGDKCFNLDAELSKSQNAYNDLLKSYSQLEKHCIYLELTLQLNQESFQKNESCDNQNALEIPEYFKNNDLKAQLKDKDTTICKLKDTIKSLRKNNKEENVNHNRCELETINEELENRKETVDNDAQIPSTTTIVPGMFKLDLDPLALVLLQNRDAHIDYLKHTQEQADILRGIELLVYVRDMYPNAIKLSAKKVVVIPENNVKKVRFAEPLTSSSKQVESSKSSDFNTLVLSSTGVKCSYSYAGSKPTIAN
ncbi:hypothetical protein Tco_1376571 [Tanacetum coccineum]